MANSVSFSVSRNDSNGDRFCSFLNMHRHQDQSLQQHRLRRDNHHHQLDQEIAVADADDRSDSDNSNTALSTRSLISASSFSFPSRPVTNITNLDSFLDSVTPIVAAHKSSEVVLNLKFTTSVREVPLPPYYCLGDLWETFREWSAYGVGVPLSLFGRHPTTQFYVPFLSGMQLYIDPHNTHMDLKCRGEENDGSYETLVFEYMEQEQPHARRPLADKVSNLASQFPDLVNYKSCDISPSSWLCVAWYPIYRIPVGPTLKDLDASFLSFHSLSTQPGVYGEPAVDCVPCGSRVRLPVIGLASYKLKGSIISPYGPQECDQENALFEAATNWLHSLQALLPDYQFFVNRYPNLL
ncbi:hypothetical protein LXL04_018915 [Taraxacum kok-saghyz]